MCVDVCSGNSGGTILNDAEADVYVAAPLLIRPFVSYK